MNTVSVSIWNFCQGVRVLEIGGHYVIAMLGVLTALTCHFRNRSPPPSPQPQPHSYLGGRGFKAAFKR